MFKARTSVKATRKEKKTIVAAKVRDAGTRDGINYGVVVDFQAADNTFLTVGKHKVTFEPAGMPVPFNVVLVENDIEGNGKAFTVGVVSLAAVAADEA